MGFTSNLATLLDGLNGLNEAEKFTLANGIFLSKFGDVNVKEIHPTLGEVRKGNKIPILNDDGNFGGFPTFDGCALPSCNISSVFSEYQWCLHEIGCEVTVCMKDLEPKFQAFWNTYRKMNEGDIEDAFVQFIITIFQSSHLKGELRHAYFGDTSAEIEIPEEAPIPDKLFSGCDGFVTQMVAKATSNTDLKVAISQNSEATVALQTISDGSVIYAYLNAMYLKAVAKPWFNATNAHFELSRENANVLVGWLNTLADKSGVNCECILPNNVVSARQFTTEGLRIFGLEVKVLDFEGMMKAGGNSSWYYNGTNFTYYKNIIILAENTNMLVGYENSESLSSFNVGWDERKREIFIQGSSLFGAGVPTENFVIAY